MTRQTVQSPTTGLLLLAVVTTAGCSPPSEDDGMEEFVKDLTRKQAAQQESLVRQSERLSEASQQLVESDAQARREMVQMQSELQQQVGAERQSVDRQREKLDDERREIAQHRHRDPLIAAALIQAATLIVAALPLVICILLFRAARREEPEALVNELLVGELTADRPMLLPPTPPVPAAVEYRRSNLDGPAGPDGADAETDERSS